MNEAGFLREENSSSDSENNSLSDYMPPASIGKEYNKKSKVIRKHLNQSLAKSHETSLKEEVERQTEKRCFEEN